MIVSALDHLQCRFLRILARASRLTGFLLLGACLLLARADEPTKVEACLRAAREARRAGRYDDAQRQLESFRLLGRGTRASGSREVSRLEQSLMQAQQGDVAPVEKYLRGLLEKKDRPEALFILEALTRGYLENLQFDEARASLKEWREMKPPDAQGFYLRGWALEQLAGDFDNWGRRNVPPDAVEDYRQALGADPQHEGAGLRLGEVLLQTGKLEEARALFQVVLKRSPGNPGGLLGLSRCLRSLGKPDQSRALLDKLLEKHPRHVEALTERAQLDLETGKLDSALALVRKAVELRPYDSAATYCLSQCLRQVGRQAEVEQVTARSNQIIRDEERLRQLEKMVLGKPNDPALRCESGILLLRNGREQEGVRWLRSTVRIDPRHRPAHQALAEHYDRIGKSDLAAKHRRLARE
ncbi:MAG: tetratricopeptide repeat protein [Planctomycetes bacterium]|nr:tetratricopeptide repeat protein [Planctomycetota bacterium]